MKFKEKQNEFTLDIKGSKKKIQITDEAKDGLSFFTVFVYGICIIIALLAVPWQLIVIGLIIQFVIHWYDEI